jgi:hypothetical protein
MEGVALTLPYTVAVYMVRGWLRAASDGADTVDEEEVSRLTGYLVSGMDPSRR